MIDKRYKELFGDFWFEAPVYNFNFDNSLRFELYDKAPLEEEKILKFLKDIYKDLFTDEVFLISSYTKGYEAESMIDFGIDAELLFTFDFDTRLREQFNDVDDLEDEMMCSVYKLKNNNSFMTNLFCCIFKGGLQNYPNLVIADPVQKRFMYIYDHRGCDVVIKDKKFLREIYKKYSDWILEYNCAEIEKKLDFD